jgi:seryl-tRNA synthetase
MAGMLGEVEAATALGHQLVQASPRHHDVQGLRRQLSQEVDAAAAAHAQLENITAARAEESIALKVKLAKAEEDVEAMRQRVTDICTTALPELKEKLEAAEAEKAVLVCHASR